MSHWVLPSKKISPTRNTDFRKYDIDESFTKYYLSELKEIKKKGVEIIILPGMMGLSEYQQEKNYIRKFLRFWNDNGGWLNGRIEDYVVPDDCLQDVCFHLNKEGVDRITQVSIRDIRKIVNNM